MTCFRGDAEEFYGLTYLYIAGADFDCRPDVYCGTLARAPLEQSGAAANCHVARDLPDGGRPGGVACHLPPRASAPRPAVPVGFAAFQLARFQQGRGA